MADKREPHFPSYSIQPGAAAGLHSGWYGTCSCGWKTQPGLKKAAAMQAAIDHAREANQRGGSSR